jgi:hypothetical protein
MSTGHSSNDMTSAERFTHSMTVKMSGTLVIMVLASLSTRSEWSSSAVHVSRSRRQNRMFHLHSDFPFCVILSWSVNPLDDDRRVEALTATRGDKTGTQISNETARCGYGFCGNWTRERQQILRVNYRLVLSSERAPQNKKIVNVPQ